MSDGYTHTHTHTHTYISRHIFLFVYLGLVEAIMRMFITLDGFKGWWELKIERQLVSQRDTKHFLFHFNHLSSQNFKIPIRDVSEVTCLPA